MKYAFILLSISIPFLLPAQPTAAFDSDSLISNYNLYEFEQFIQDADLRSKEQVDIIHSLFLERVKNNKPEVLPIFNECLQKAGLEIIPVPGSDKK